MTEEMRYDQKTYYFLAGLPRSGSTLLSSLLNQNPRFYSGPSSPVLNLMNNIEGYLSNDEFFAAYPKSNQAASIIANVIQHFYNDIKKPVVFDKNRAWPNFSHYIEGYFGIQRPKIICTVRSLDEILASFIALHRRNPFQVNGKVNFIDEMLIKSSKPLTDDNRCEILAGSGVLGQSMDGIKKLFLEGRQDILHIVEYDDLTNRPRETMNRLYNFLEEDSFEHDFENIVKVYDEDDSNVYGLQDMHRVSKSLQKSSIDPKEFLSERILRLCEGQEFWRETTSLSSQDLKSVDEKETKLIGVD